jgi:hypothetical protein
MQYLATASIFPELNVLEYFFGTEHQEALEIDSSKHSHPVQPGKFQGFLFDGITYNKGASCLWMMYWYMQTYSNITMFDGLKKYLEQHPFGLVTTNELFSSLAHSTNLPIDEKFMPWVRNPGYPVIQVSHQLSLRKITLTFKVRQYRLWKDSSRVIWPVFVNMTVILESHQGQSQLQSVSVWLTRKSDVVEYELPGSDANFKALLLNPQRVGFYRSQYSSELIKSLESEMPKLRIADKMGLISDTVALVLGGYVSLHPNWLMELKDTMSFMETESHPDIWDFFLDQLLKLEVAVRNTHNYDSLLGWIHQLLERLISDLTWKPTLHPLNPSKSKIFHFAIRFQHKETVDAALQYFDGQLEYDPTLHSVVLEAAVRYGNRFDEVLKIILDTQDFANLNTLGATQSRPEQLLLVERFRESPQFAIILHSLLEYGSFEVVWHAIKETMVGNLSKYESLLEATVTQFVSRHLLREAKKYKNKAIQRGLERAKALQRFREAFKY